MKQVLVMLIIGGSAVTGCSVLETKVAPRASAAINTYCVQSLEERLLLRQQVNQAIAPNTVRIDCAGDPQ